MTRVRTHWSLALLLAAPLPAQHNVARQAALDSRERIRLTMARHSEAWLGGTRPNIHIDDTAVPFDELCRAVAFEVAHHPERVWLHGVLIDDECAAQIDDGRDLSDFEWDDDAVTSVDDPKGRLERELDRQTALFERVFIHGPADEWPQVTRDSVPTTDDRFWENLDKASRRDEGLPPFWKQLMRGWVLRQLTRDARPRYPSHGLPDDVVVRLVGRDWTTAGAFEIVRRFTHPDELTRALTDVVVRAILRRELVESGHWLPDDEARDRLARFERDRTDADFGVDVAARLRGFQHLEAFRYQLRIRHSFEALDAMALDDAVLRTHIDRRRGQYTDARIDVELMQFPERDPRTGAWRIGGLDVARRAALAARTALDGGQSFASLRNERDPPTDSEAPKRALQRARWSELRHALGESEASDLALGISIADQLLFDADTGAVLGPLRGADGYWLARVTARHAAAIGTVDLDDPAVRQRVRNDAVHDRFCDWANEVVLRARIR